MMNSCNELIEKAENLKKELNNERNGLSSDGSGKGEWVSNRTSLQDVYRQLLITNLEYALDKKVEQELWNFVFKNHITALQQQVKDKSNTYRAEAQSQLTMFLDAASGFYTHLLDDLCQTFQVNIPYRVSSSKLFFLKDANYAKRQSSIAQPERPSCQYMCQHCLVHLGDIARYRNQIGQAESYYRYAAHLVPSNGQPYNQLAILAAASGDVLGTAFYYCRSLAVKCPFPGSDTNLRKQLSKIMAGDGPRHTKISTSELVKFCLKFHGCIYLKKNEKELKSIADKLSGYIRAHLRAGSLSRQQITYITFLNLFSLHHLSPNGLNEVGAPVNISEENSNDQSDSSENKEVVINPSPEENIAWSAILTFTMHMLAGLLACVPVHSDDAADLEHPALPSIKITLDWLASNTAALHRVEVVQSSRVWPRLAKVLNALGNQDNANNMQNRYLPEDLDVRGFIGLKLPLSKIDFVGGVENGMLVNMEHACRCYRLFQLGMTISQANNDLLICTEENTGTVFSSNVSLSPQHGADVNGVEDISEEESEEEKLKSDTESYDMPTSPQASGGKYKEVLFEPQSIGNTVKKEIRTKGVLKVLTDDHSSSIKKKNRPPRKQNVAVQIKPEHKLKAIEEEGSYCENSLPGEDLESEEASTESSQGETSASVSHSRSGYRVTFAAPQVSPTQYLKEDTPPPPPPPVVSGYMDQGNMMLHNMPMYADSNSQLVQPPYMSNMHVVSQQLGPIYRHPPVGSPILTGHFARRGLGPYHFPPNMIPRPQRQMAPFQHMQPNNTPPHPADLPKPIFHQTSLYNPVRSSENYRLGNPNPQIPMPLASNEGGLDQVAKMSRPTDLTYIQRLHQNSTQSISAMSPISQDSSPTQRLVGPNMTMAAHFNRPFMSMSVMQQLRMQEMAPDSTNKGHMDSSSVSGLSFHGQGLMKNMQQNPRLDFSQFGVNQQQQQMMMRQQQSGISRSSGYLSSGHLPPLENDLSRTPSELARSYFQQNFMGPSPTNAGESNNTSSTSSPTPSSINNQLGSIPNSSCSPQAGSAANFNYTGVGHMRSHGFSSSMLMDQAVISGELEMQRRPNTLSNQQMVQQSGVGFSSSPSQNLTPSGLGSFSHLEQGENEYSRDANAISASSMFGLSPSSASHLTDDLRQLGQPSVKNPTMADNYPPYTIPQDRVKAIFEDATASKTNFSPLSKNSMDPLQSNQQPVDKFHDSLLNKEDKDSYKLFPDTDSAWGISRGSRGEGLGLTGLGTIGSERAAAHHVNQRYSAWGAPSISSAITTGASSLPSKADRPTQKSSEMISSSQGEGFDPSQSFWSSPMMPSGPSALEQLIRQQQQHHVTRDKSPP